MGEIPVGIRPIEIGDVIRRAAAKCVLLVAGASATSECGADQLCAGLKAGVEGGVHAVFQAWAETDADEKNGFLVIDAENAFNSMSRVNMLWTVRHLWPAGARFAFNCYSFYSLLICRNSTGEPLTMWSKEGQIQGDPLSMFLYGIGILPLIRKLKQLHVDCIQPWFADDAAALGEWYRLVLLYEDLLLYGKGYGYFPNPVKCKVVVHPGHEALAHEFFNVHRSLGFEICTGTRYLGGWIGTEVGRDEYVTEST